MRSAAGILILPAQAVAKAKSGEDVKKGKTQYTMEPEDEAAFLLRRAYPDPNNV